MTTKNKKDQIFGALARLLGGKITHLVNDGNPNIDERFFGLQITRDDGKKVVLWLLSDFEGNAPGGFDIDES